MEWLLPALIAFVCFILVFYVQQRQFERPEIRLPYRLRQPALTEDQREVLAALEQRFGSTYLVLAQVRAAHVVEVVALPRRGYWYHAVNRLAPLHFDYLLCRRDNGFVACAIQLPDTPGGPADLLPELCRTIGLPLLQPGADALNVHGWLVQQVAALLTGAEEQVEQGRGR